MKPVESFNIKPVVNNVSWEAEITPNRENYPLNLDDNAGHSQPSWRQSDSMMGNSETERYFIIVVREGP